jgi:transcriptional regulator with XRE-family HTH domain
MSAIDESGDCNLIAKKLTSMEYMSAGARIKQLRLLAGLSQDQLAEQSGLSLRSIQRIEHGDTVPRGDSLQRISKALNVTVETLTTHRETIATVDRPALKDDPKIPLFIILSAFGYLWNPLLGVICPGILWLLFRNSTIGVQEMAVKIIRLGLLFCLILALTYAYLYSQKLSIINIPLSLNGKSIQVFITGMYIANALAIFGILLSWTRIHRKLERASFPTQ